MVQSTKKIIQERIESGPSNKICFADDFKDVADNEQVRLALSRLTKEGVIIRLGQGIYVYPVIDPELGKLRPSLEEIAQAIAERDKISIKPTGATALNRLGLSTQVPMKVVYMTDGISRKIKIGKGTITFRKTTPRKMAYKGKISSLIIEAMEELGKDGLETNVRERMEELVQKEDPQVLKENIKLAPHWIAEELLELIKKSENV